MLANWLVLVSPCPSWLAGWLGFSVDFPVGLFRSRTLSQLQWSRVGNEQRSVLGKHLCMFVVVFSVRFLSVVHWIIVGLDRFAWAWVRIAFKFASSGLALLTLIFLIYITCVIGPMVILGISTSGKTPRCAKHTKRCTLKREYGT